MKHFFCLVIFIFGWVTLEARPVFKISSSSGPNSSFVDVEFKVDSFIDISATQFSINWNPAIIEFNELITTGSQLPNGSLTNDNINTSIPGFPGTGIFSWNTSGSFITLPNNSTFFKIRFKLIGSSGQTSPVNIVNTPLSFEYVSASGTFYSIGSVSGSVTISGTAGNSVKFIASSETAAPGANVCVKVSTEGFTNISSFQYAIQFNPSVLEFVQVNGINLTGLTSSNFVSNNTTGFVNVVWSSADPVTAADGTKIYELCFKVKDGASGSSDITFGPNPPLTVEITGTAGNYNLTSTTGRVTVGGGNTGCTPTGLGVGITRDTVPTGNKAVVYFKAYGFTNIEGYQFTIRFDKDKLRFDSVRAVYFPGANIDNDFNIASAASGKILTIYSTATPLTRPNASDIFAIAFTVIGSTGTTADISIGLDATEQLPLDFIPGGSAVQVCKGFIYIGDKTVVNPDDCTLTATAAMTRQATCPSTANGAAQVTESASARCNLPIRYLWDNGETTKTANALTSGTHFVTVTDSSTPAKVVVTSVVITAASEPTIVPVITNVLCNGQSNGSISLTVTPSTGVTYQWSNGTTGNSISNIPAGSYSVVIFYGGCSITRNYQVTANAPISIGNKNVTQTQAGQSTGSISFTATGGTGTYTYFWAPGGQTPTPIRTSLAAGTYVVTVTDTNGCTTSDSFVVTTSGGTNPINIAVTTSNLNGFNVKCDGICDGSITLQVTGGNGQFSYKWNDGSTLGSRANLCKGNYQVTVTDGLGATKTADITLTAPSAILLSEVNKICTDSTMNVCITVSGGVTPYTYEWSNASSTTACLVNVTPKSYTLVIRDANNCPKTIVTECSETSGKEECNNSKVLTPNGDSKNDVFYISCVDNNKNSLEVFDRWGKLVYNTVNYTNDWTGLGNNNQELPTGGYFFVLTLKNSTGATTKLVKGSLTILRN